ncbi:transmembrane gamma-carboxyglutamic acid protein 4-like [Acipenser oxyrinchus oxyrinchus]|uniref:Transmembrane gamma-carboxyglutamic acid protein 4-like n=1 Tax=Acipenser oxyrinchus oxyrinchus TaxID=40147 RepID=A0AAD8FZA7_ACIOX|nr:transmembrane gamma-carboxyglutamic acid protein 4-like [Acipenser oxyrinchus oxyrinchus]
MALRLLVMCQLITCGFSRCTGKLLKLENNKHISDNVFMNEDEASKFLGRHLLLNHFDFELFTPGNLERECYEEVCNYEEAREVFENVDGTNMFWQQYIANGYAKPGDQQSQSIDVTALLTGLVAAGVSLVFIGLLSWYFCQKRCKGRNQPGSSEGRVRRSNASLVVRLEEVSLTLLQPAVEGPGLPSYAQAIATSGQYDAPPPPYPGSRSGTMQR